MASEEKISTDTPYWWINLTYWNLIKWLQDQSITGAVHQETTSVTKEQSLESSNQFSMDRLTSITKRMLKDHTDRTSSLFDGEEAFFQRLQSLEKLLTDKESYHNSHLRSAIKMQILAIYFHFLADIYLSNQFDSLKTGDPQQDHALGHEIWNRYAESEKRIANIEKATEFMQLSQQALLYGTIDTT